MSVKSLSSFAGNSELDRLADEVSDTMSIVSDDSHTQELDGLYGDVTNDANRLDPKSKDELLSDLVVVRQEQSMLREKLESSKKDINTLRSEAIGLRDEIANKNDRIRELQIELENGLSQSKATDFDLVSVIRDSANKRIENMESRLNLAQIMSKQTVLEKERIERELDQRNAELIKVSKQIALAEMHRKRQEELLQVNKTKMASLRERMKELGLKYRKFLQDINALLDRSMKRDIELQSAQSRMISTAQTLERVKKLVGATERVVQLEESIAEAARLLEFSMSKRERGEDVLAEIIGMHRSREALLKKQSEELSDAESQRNRLSLDLENSAREISETKKRCEEALSANEALANDLKDSQSHTAQLEEDIKKAQAQLQTAASQIQELGQQIQIKDTEIQKLAEENAKKTQETEWYATRIRTLEESKQKEYARRDELLKALSTDSASTIQGLQNQIQMLDRLREEETRAHEKRLQTLADDLQAQIATREEQISDMTKEQDARVQSHKEALERLENIANESKDYASVVEAKHEELEKETLVLIKQREEAAKRFAERVQALEQERETERLSHEAFVDNLTKRQKEELHAMDEILQETKRSTALEIQKLNARIQFLETQSTSDKERLASDIASLEQSKQYEMEQRIELIKNLEARARSETQKDEEIRTLNASIEDHKKLLDQRAQEISRENQRFGSVIEELNKIIQQERERADALEGREAEASKHALEQEKAIESLKALIEIHTSAIKEREDDIRSLENEVQQNNKSLNVLKNEIGAVQQELLEERSLKVQMEHDAHRIEEEKRHLAEKTEQLRLENSKLQELMTSSAGERDSMLKEKIQHVQDSENKIKELEEELQIVKSRVQTQERIEKRLQEDLDAKTDRVAELTTRVSALEEEQRSQKDTIDKLELNAKFARESIERLTQELGIEKQLSAEQLEKISELNTEIEKRRAKQEELERKAKQYEEARAEIEQSLAQKQEQIQSLSLTLEERERSLEESRVATDAFKNELQLKSDTLSSLQEASKLLQEQLDALTKENSATKESLQTCDADLGRALRELAATKSLLEDSERELKGAQEREAATSQEQEQTEKMLRERLEQHEKALIAKHKERERELADEIATIKDTVEIHKKLSEQNQAIADASQVSERLLREEVKILKREVQRLETASDAMQLKRSEMFKDFTTKVREEGTVRAMLDDKELVQIELQAQIERLESKIKEYETQQEANATEIERLKTREKELEEELKKHIEHEKELQLQIESHVETEKTLRSRIEEEGAKIKELQRSQESLQLELSQRKPIDETPLQQQIAALTQERDALARQLQTRPLTGVTQKEMEFVEEYRKALLLLLDNAIQMPVSEKIVVYDLVKRVINFTRDYTTSCIVTGFKDTDTYFSDRKPVYVSDLGTVLLQQIASRTGFFGQDTERENATVQACLDGISGYCTRYIKASLGDAEVNPAILVGFAAGVRAMATLFLNAASLLYDLRLQALDNVAIFNPDTMLAMQEQGNGLYTAMNPQPERGVDTGSDLTLTDLLVSKRADRSEPYVLVRCLIIFNKNV